MDYRIVCVNKSAPTHPGGHGHIVTVGIGNDNGWTNRLSVPDVYRLMNQGNRFYTVGPTSHKTAFVEPWKCCGVATLRSKPDSVWDNNLDNLSVCQV